MEFDNFQTVHFFVHKIGELEMQIARMKSCGILFDDLSTSIMRHIEFNEQATEVLNNFRKNMILEYEKEIANLKDQIKKL